MRRWEQSGFIYLCIYLSIILSYLQIIPVNHIYHSYLSLAIYLSIYICLSISLSIYLSISLSIYLSISLSIYLPTYLSIYLSHLSFLPIYLSISRPLSLFIYLSISLSLYLSISLSIYLSISLISLCLYFSISVCFYLYFSISLSLHLSIYISLSLSLSISLYQAWGLGYVQPRPPHACAHLPVQAGFGDFSTGGSPCLRPLPSFSLVWSLARPLALALLNDINPMSPECSRLTQGLAWSLRGMLA